MDDPVHQVATAFSLTAEKYDRFAEDHPNLTRIHSIVYAHLFKHLSPAAHILEINAGTGTDAIHLAQHAFFVYATDIAPGMLERLQEKVIRFGLEEQVRVQRCSFTELDKLKEEGFDAVFSNLGGLNCIPDLKPIIDTLPSVIRPGGNCRLGVDAAHLFMGTHPCLPGEFNPPDRIKLLADPAPGTYRRQPGSPGD